ncbi:MAG: hypothetical protein HQK84_09625 [Nitrospinae bacterium]|nr:hypothetical protein [Nitrospinota bacterium]
MRLTWELLKLQSKILSIVAQEKEISQETIHKAIHDVEGNFAFHKLSGANLYPKEIEDKIIRYFALYGFVENS